MNDQLHPLAREAMRLAVRPRAEAEQRLAELAGDDLAGLDAAHRGLCRRLGARPDDYPASVALRMIHALRDQLRSADRPGTLTSTEVELVGTAP